MKALMGWLEGPQLPRQRPRKPGLLSFIFRRCQQAPPSPKEIELAASAARQRSRKNWFQRHPVATAYLILRAIR